MVLESLEDRLLLTVQPTPVTLTPNPAEAVPFANTIVATFISPSDPNPGDFTAGSSINWGDSTTDTFPAGGLAIVPLGTTSTGPQFAVEGSHTYGEAYIGESLPVTVTIHDNVDATDAAVVSTASIVDAPLTNSGPVPFSGTEGTTLTSIPLATFFRPSTDHNVADYVASVDWGDGTPIDPTAVVSIASQGTGGAPDTVDVAGSHTYAHKGTYNVAVKLTDHGVQSSTVVDTATIHGATLTSTLTTTIDAATGSPLTGVTVAAFTDSNLLAGPGDFAASVSWGGVVVPGTVVQTGPGAFAVLSSHTFSTPATNVPVTTTVVDTAGTVPVGDLPTTLVNTGSVTADVVASPLILTASPIVATAGTDLLTGTLLATFQNTAGPGNLADYSATVDFGNGLGAIAAQIVANGSTYAIYAPTAPAIVYATSGTYPVQITVTDTVAGISAPASTTATVTAAPLVAAATQPVVTATQQTPLKRVQVSSFTDANTLLPLTAFTASIDWGDGTPNTTGQVVEPGGVGTPYFVLGSHTYADPTTTPATPDPITVTIHADGASVVTATTASVAASVLTGTPSPVLAVEGMPLTNVRVATFTDAALPGPIGAYSAMIDWGTGTPTVGTIVPLGGGTFAVEGSFTYSGEFAPPQPPYAITTTISHDGIAATTVTSPVTISGAALSGMAIPVYATVAKPFTGDVAFFTDANPSGVAADFTATIVWGDGGTTVGTVVAAGGGFVVTGADPNSGAGYTFAKAGTYVDSVTVNSVSGSTFTAYSTATVAPAKLTVTGVTLTAPIYPAFTATTTSPLATIVDADPAATPAGYTVTINWGDGKVTPGSVAVDPSGAFVVLGSHQYAATGTYSVIIGVSSTSGSSAQAVSTLDVTDTPLTVGPPTIIQATQGKPFTATVATFTNPNPFSVAADYASMIAWGDGTTSSGTVVKLQNGVFAVVGSHTYATMNLGGPAYPVTVAIQDGGIGGSTASVVDAAIVYSATPLSLPSNFTIPVDQQYTGAVATFIQGNLSPVGLIPGTSYTTSIDWGDGTPPTAGTVVAIPGGFQVIGTHTYLNARTTGNSDVFPVTVAIGDNAGDFNLITSLATVTDAAFTAMLSPSTDTGISPLDAMTTDEQPVYYGQAEAGAKIDLFAIAAGSTTSNLVAVTSANASGAWSTPTSLLFNGKYLVTAVEIDGSGNILTSVQASPTASQGPLVVDTTGPRVIAVTFGPKAGQITVTFQGGVSGLDPQSLANANNYTLQKGTKSFGKLLVTSIDTNLPNGMARVVVTINHGKKLGGGTYLLTFRSGGIKSLAGAPLDGLYYGSFPSGDGIPGGNFVAEIDFAHHKVYAPRTVIGTAKPIQASPLPAVSATIAAKTTTSTVKAADLVPLDVQDAALDDLGTLGHLTKKKKS